MTRWCRRPFYHSDKVCVAARGCQQSNKIEVYGGEAVRYRYGGWLELYIYVCGPCPVRRTGLLWLIALLGIGVNADVASIGIPASSISVRYRSIPVPDWGTLIPVPDCPAFRHLTKLHNGTSTEGSSVRL